MNHYSDILARLKAAPALISTPDMLKILGCSRSTLYRTARQGRIPRRVTLLGIGGWYRDDILRAFENERNKAVQSMKRARTVC